MSRFSLVLGALLALCGCKTTTPTLSEIRANEMLKGLRVAILATDGFEQVELTKPKKALEEAGAEVSIVSPEDGKIQGFNKDEKADRFRVDVPLNRATADKFDALVLPGGVKNPDKLRLVPEAIQFIKDIADKKKPIAAICHGPWTLINANAVKGEKVTSWPSLQTDLENAGAEWVDQEVVVSNNLVTSRKPEDIPAFNQAMIELFYKHLSKKR